MSHFDVPVAVFMFKRTDKTAQIVDQIGKVKPKRLYLIGDGPRYSDEAIAVEECRRVVESRVTWDCEIIRNYANKNRGVYENIAGGAQWVFTMEEKAIFLEDDNFPDESFFPYCEELLNKYESDSRILWICGTNYMGQYEMEDGSDYCFTKLMLPCGWASWSNKFLSFYDGHINLFNDPVYKRKVEQSYSNRLLYKHDLGPWIKIIKDLKSGKKPVSWDYQMAFALRCHNLYGIAPKYNLIRNIGADQESIHGGTSMSNVMTRRFCEVPTLHMPSPLKHPQALLIDLGFEKNTERIIIPPFKLRLKSLAIKYIKLLLGKDPSKHFSEN